MARTRMGDAGSMNSPRVMTSTMASPKRALPLGRRIERAVPLAPTERLSGESTVLLGERRAGGLGALERDGAEEGRVRQEPRDDGNDDAREENRDAEVHEGPLDHRSGGDEGLVRDNGRPWPR